MRILFATPEAAPYWKTGGLADVARALPDALSARGHEVLIVLPRYRVLRERGPQAEVVDTVRIPWPDGGMPVRYLLDQPEGRAAALLVDQPYFFDTPDPYGPTRHDDLAVGRRFALFSRAVAERARAWRADVVHLNDWPTGLTPLYLRLDGPPVPTVFAIHNLAYQGNFEPALLGQIGVPGAYFRTEGGVEFYGNASFMKAGLALADRLVTVSPTYAREIQTSAYGEGFDGLLRHRKDDLTGILNGIDPHTWNPATDGAIKRAYDADRLEAKDLNREALLTETGLDGAGPVLAMVTRLAHQKGIELILEALPRLLELGMRLVVLGEGETRYETALAEAADERPDRIAVTQDFDDALARRIYAGADFFLMPSLYEPCGLGQMIAQRYGTPPIVRRTGGLIDTVRDGRTGLVFDAPDAAALVQAVRRARDLWRGPEWDPLRRRCMMIDSSWDRSAARYEELYRTASRTPTG